MIRAPNYFDSIISQVIALDEASTDNLNPH